MKTLCPSVRFKTRGPDAVPSLLPGLFFRPLGTSFKVRDVLESLNQDLLFGVSLT